MLGMIKSLWLIVSEELWKVWCLTAIFLLIAPWHSSDFWTVSYLNSAEFGPSPLLRLNTGKNVKSRRCKVMEFGPFYESHFHVILRERMDHYGFWLFLNVRRGVGGLLSPLMGLLGKIHVKQTQFKQASYKFIELVSAANHLGKAWTGTPPTLHSVDLCLPTRCPLSIGLHKCCRSKCPIGDPNTLHWSVDHNCYLTDKNL